MLGRAVLVAIAVTVLVWFGVLARDVLLADSGASLQQDALLKSGQSSLQGGSRSWTDDIIRSDHRLQQSEFLNPDQAPVILRGQTYLFLAHAARPLPALAHAATVGAELDQARRLARSVTRSEPENIEGWTLLNAALGGSSPQGIAQILRLDPLARAGH